MLPAPPTGYHAELEELARIKVAPVEDRTVQSYYYLLNTCHSDDEDNLLYQVTRLAISKEGWIVGYRGLVTKAGIVSREEKVPIHVADLHRMTADLHSRAPDVPVLDEAPGPSSKRARDSPPV